MHLIKTIIIYQMNMKGTAMKLNTLVRKLLKHHMDFAILTERGVRGIIVEPDGMHLVSDADDQAQMHYIWRTIKSILKEIKE